MHNEISRSFPLVPLFELDPTSFEDVILLIPVASPKRQSIEGDSEVPVVKGVNERIHSAVHPSKPCEETFQVFVEPNAVLRQEWPGNVVNEEGEPTSYEA